VDIVFADRKNNLNLTVSGGGGSGPSGFTFNSGNSGYSAIKDKGRRKPARTSKPGESSVLNQHRRDRLQGTVYDLIRNSVEAKWALNKMLNYCCNFYFQSTTGFTEFDDALERSVARWMMAKNCDVARRHNFPMLLRLHGAGVMLDGDSLLLKLRDFRLQGIEADRIRGTGHNTPKNFAAAPGASDGLVLDNFGAVDKYLICNRSANGYDFAAAVDWKNAFFSGVFFRFDQVRGVSPLAFGAVNKFQDIGEIDEYQMIKTKKHACFGLAVMSNDPGSGFNDSAAPLSPSLSVAAPAPDSPEALAPRYDFELDAGLKLELAAGDTIDMFESKTPSQEYQSFAESQLRKGLLAFNVPYTFYNSNGSTYSANKQDRAEFRLDIRPYQKQFSDLCYDVSEWLIPFLIKKDNIPVPKPYADRLDLLRYDWIPEAEPWLDEKAEIEAAALRISCGLSSREKECRRRGGDFYDNARALKREQTYLEKSGIVYAIGQPGQQLVNLPNSNAPTASAADQPQPAETPAADASYDNPKQENNPDE